MNHDPLAARPHPAASYAEALGQAQALQAADGTEVDPRCRTALLSHGQRVRRAFVLFHGFTNCPQQFVTLGQMLHDKGANVLIPRAPGHGLRDRMTDALSRLTASDLARYADTAVDCACGLADEVVVAGLSSGGVLAAWVAQNRPDVAHALVISPAFAIGPVPHWVAPAVAQLLRHMPNQFRWWDSNLKERLATPPYGYPRYPTRGVSAVFEMGAAVRDAARQRAPRAPSIVVVLNGADQAVSAAPVHALIADWRAHGAAVRTSMFPASLGLQHDVIDPHHLGEQQDAVYPTLLALLEPAQPR